MEYIYLEVKYFCMTSRGGANLLLLSPVYSRSIHIHVKLMRSHDVVSKFAYVSIVTYIRKCVHVNGV